MKKILLIMVVVVCMLSMSIVVNAATVSGPYCKTITKSTTVSFADFDIKVSYKIYDFGRGFTQYQGITQAIVINRGNLTIKKFSYRKYREYIDFSLLLGKINVSGNVDFMYNYKTNQLDFYRSYESFH